LIVEAVTGAVAVGRDDRPVQRRAGAVLRNHLAAERRQLTASASAGNPATSQVAETIRGGAAVLGKQALAGLVWTCDDQGQRVLANNAAGIAYAPGSATPNLDELERHLFGPGQEERWAEQDLAAERGLSPSSKPNGLPRPTS
jgi:hypothetical protein